MGGLVSGLVSIPESITEATLSRGASDKQLTRELAQADVAINAAQEKGAYESAKQRMMTSQLMAKQKQAYEASGVDSTQGTAASVQANTAALGEMDAQQLAINAAREAWGHNQQKKQAREEYDTRLTNINTKESFGVLGGATKFIGGAASMAASG